MIHELGHGLTGVLLKFKLNRIEIYPYGGCSKLEYDINTPIFKEFFVLIMGPITQIIFVYIVKIFNFQVPNYFYLYHYLILVFNLLPIFPLDGGRLVQLILFLIFPYYYSQKHIIYFSFFLYLVLFLSFIFFNLNLVAILIFILLGTQIYLEIKKADYYFEKFLIERCFNNYSFNKYRIVFDIKQMKRDYYHYFILKNNYCSEIKFLKKYFKL